MRTGLKLAALGIALIVVALWFFGGLNTGRTQTNVPVASPTGTIQENRFLPGIDFLALGLACSAALYASSLLCRPSPDR